MKILVAIKRVVDYKSHIRIKSDQSGIETANVKMSINPFDEIALEEARKMKLEQDPAVADRLNNVLFFAYIEKKLAPEFDKMTVSDAETKNWYEKNPEILTWQWSLYNEDFQITNTFRTFRNQYPG